MSLLLLLLAWTQAWAGTLTVDVLDVGQGDAILLTSPAGKTVLIDAGTGRPDVVPMLAARGIAQLDLVIATHAHADHIGGMDEVLEAVPVRIYGDQGLPHTTATYARVMELVEQKGMKYITLRDGRVFNLDDGVRIEVIAPGEPLLTNTRSDLNSNSVVTRVTHGDNCFLFVGDAEDPTERRLVAEGLEPCAVLKVAHHGSEHSSSAEWLAAVKPGIALISVGQGNRYGHPDPEALDRIHRAGAKIFRTDELGTIRVRSDKQKVEVVPLGPEPYQGDVAAIVPSPPPDRVLPDGPGIIDVNAATAAELVALPGIGPSKADAIVRWREANGPYRSLDDLDAVPGIGPATLAGLTGRVVFGP